MASPRDEILTIRVGKEMRIKMNAVAKDLGVTRSWMIRKCFEMSKKKLIRAPNV